MKKFTTLLTMAFIDVLHISLINSLMFQVQSYFTVSLCHVYKNRATDSFPNPHKYTLSY